MVVGLAREKFEREAGGLRPRSMSRFVGRREGDDRIEPLTLQSFAVELSLTAGRREVTLGEGKKGRGVFCRPALGLDGRGARLRTVRRGEIQADAMLALQPIAGDSSEP